ncbi:MAG: two-component regulator propeller domain-containing protein [Bacteroidota bacterium]
MLTRCLLYFLLCTAVLQGQGTGHWQTYFQNYRLLGGAEADGALWLAGQNSILKINQADSSEELLHFRNSPLSPDIYAIHDLPGNRFVLLEPDNRLLYYNDGTWERQTLNVSSNEILNRIVGVDLQGQVLVASSQRVYRIDIDGTTHYLPYDQFLENNFVHLTAVDQQGHFWLAAYPNLLCFNNDSELVFSFALDTHSPYDLEVDGSDNAWLLTQLGLYVWDSNAAMLYLVDGIGTEFPAGGDIVATLDNGIIVSTQQRLFEIKHLEGTTWQTSEITGEFTYASIPARWTYHDQNGVLWYLDALNRLQYWHPNQQNPARVWPTVSWLPMGEIEGLSLDPQGKLWIGGFNQVSYLQGGRWHNLPIDSVSFSIPKTFSIAFNEQERPIVGNTSFAFFGFPETDLREWNGTSWDTLEQAVVANLANPISDLINDRDGNLWVLQEFTELFSVRSEGQWFRFKASDFNGDINVFNCLYENPKGGMWIGTDNGLLFYDGFQFEHTTAAEMGIGDAPISGITIDEQGEMWVAGSFYGVWRRKDDSWIAQSLPWEIGSTAHIHKIVNGTYPELWAALSHNGALHYDGQEWTYLNAENSGLVGNGVTNILHDHRGRTWFSSTNSLSVFHSNTEPIGPYKLPSEQTVAVFPNPSCCQFSVFWQAQQPGTFDLALHDIKGRMVREWSTIIGQAQEYTFQFQDYDLVPGTYSLSVSQDGVLIGTSLLVVIR